jgi:hypothetical protein
MVGSGGLTSIVKLVVIKPPLFVAVTVTDVGPWVVVGVPLISPVELIINKPLGSVVEVYVMLAPVMVGLGITASTP